MSATQKDETNTREYFKLIGKRLGQVIELTLDLYADLGDPQPTSTFLDLDFFDCFWASGVFGSDFNETAQIQRQLHVAVLLNWFQWPDPELPVARPEKYFAEFAWR